MLGVTVCSVLYLVLLFLALLNFYTTSGQKVHNNAFKHIQQETAKVATVLRSLNLSTVNVLENLKHYEDGLVGSVGEFVDTNVSCSKALERLFLRLLEGKIEAIQMIDASSVYQSGLTYGNIWNLGSYDECLRISVHEDGMRFLGMHCFVNLQFTYVTLPLIEPGEVTDVGIPANLWFSVCMPSVCKPSSLENSLNSFANSTNEIIDYFNYSIAFKIDESNCHTSASQPVTPTEIFGIAVTCLMLGIAGMCTLVDMVFISTGDTSELKKDDLLKVCPYVVAFSMYTNGKRLLETKVSDNSIQVLHCLKFIGMVWIVAGYHVKMTILNPLSNTLGALDFISRWTTIVVLNVPLAVDLFFITSAILNTYTYLKMPSRRTFIGHIGSYVHRYIRLTPAYAVMMLVTASWYYRLGDGPLWDLIVGDARDNCRHYWWSGLLYINNYYNPSENCLFQSWYLAVDMQLFLFSPLILYCLWRWPRVGLLQLTVLIAASIAEMFYVAYIYELKTPVVLNYSKATMNRQVDVLYMPTHTNTISYAFGILCGYFLYHIKKKKVVISVHPVLYVVIWLLVITAMCWALVGDFSLYQFDTVYNRMHSALLIAFYRFVWSLVVVWVIVVCNTGNGGPLKSFLSLRMWMPLGRLTYSIYLTHAAVILYTIGALKDPQYFGYYVQKVAVFPSRLLMLTENLVIEVYVLSMVLKGYPGYSFLQSPFFSCPVITEFVGELVVVIILAVILSLTVEAPIMVLEKLLLGVQSYEKRSDLKSIKSNTDGDKRTLEINLPRVLRTTRN